jgi:hypothetical protein
MSRRVKPHQVRGRELEEVREKDPDGRIVVHHRTVDTLATMLKSAPSLRKCTTQRVTSRQISSSRSSTRCALYQYSRCPAPGASRS